MLLKFNTEYTLFRIYIYINKRKCSYSNKLELALQYLYWYMHFLFSGDGPRKFNPGRLGLALNDIVNSLRFVVSFIFEFGFVQF